MVIYQWNTIISTGEEIKRIDINTLVFLDASIRI